VIGIDGRRIEFSICATDGNEQIGVGTHERVVLQLSKLSERLKARFGERCDQAMSLERIRITPASAIAFHAPRTDPSMSMPRHASSIT
jgi:hypothetical protein